MNIITVQNNNIETTILSKNTIKDDITTSNNTTIEYQ